MAFDPALIGWVAEAMEPVGSVTHRRMMGGATLYCDGTVFAIVAHDALWFKADRVSDADWDALGCARFTVQMGDRVGTMNYRRAPDEVHDDADELRRLGEMALAAGLRAPPKRSSAPRCGPPRKPADAGTRRG